MAQSYGAVNLYHQIESFPLYRMREEMKRQLLEIKNLHLNLDYLKNGFKKGSGLTSSS